MCTVMMLESITRWHHSYLVPTTRLLFHYFLHVCTFLVMLLLVAEYACGTVVPLRAALEN